MPIFDAASTRPDMTKGSKIVTALLITRSAPTRPSAAVEIPAPVKRHLGLDDQRS
jgi:hypothetical protein